jgi:hypothetical protein
VLAPSTSAIASKPAMPTRRNSCSSTAPRCAWGSIRRSNYQIRNSKSETLPPSPSRSPPAPRPGLDQGAEGHERPAVRHPHACRHGRGAGDRVWGEASARSRRQCPQIRKQKAESRNSPRGRAARLQFFSRPASPTSSRSTWAAKRKLFRLKGPKSKPNTSSYP